LREDFGYPDAQKTPRSPNPPEHGHRKTLVPHGTHSDLPPPGNEAKPGSGGSRTPAFHGYQVRFDGFRIATGPDRRGRVTEPQSLTAASIASRRAGRFSHLAWGTGVHWIRHEARINHENVTKGAGVRVAAPGRRLGDLDAAARAGRRRVRPRAGLRRRPRGSSLALKPAAPAIRRLHQRFRCRYRLSTPEWRPRGVAAIPRPARGGQAPPAARYYGRYRSRSAQRTGGSGGSFPRASTAVVPPEPTLSPRRYLIVAGLN
jgi:hypothetical protein